MGFFLMVDQILKVLLFYFKTKKVRSTGEDNPSQTRLV
jgi:hypothetical protein